jgi:hypothetical protein
MSITIEDFTSVDLIQQNVLYYIDGKKVGNSVIQFAACNNKILKYSNEWLYLISVYFIPEKLNGIYSKLLHYHKVIFEKNVDKQINKRVIPFITSFSTGTVHGYSGIYYILFEYINNYEKYKEYDIIVYKDSQKGILDIINNAIENKYINEEKVIFISHDTIYLFDEIYIIPNKNHSYFPPSKFTLDINDYISKNIILKSYNHNYGDKIALLKTSITENNTQSGILSHMEAVTLTSKSGYTLLDLNRINDEIKLINIIHDCTVFLTSWGTAFMKNYVYISNKCKKIIVLIIGDDYKNQYNHHLKTNSLGYKFKNAIIEYKYM